MVNRKGAVFYHGNGNPRTSLATRREFGELEWGIFMHLSYSSDYALSNYHLFRSQQNSRDGANLVLMGVEKSHLLQLFAQKP